MFKYPSPITKEDVPVLLKNVKIAQKKRKCNSLILKVAALAFTLCLILMTVTLASLASDILMEKQWLSPAISFIRASIVLRPEANPAVRIILSFAFVIVPPIVAALLLKLACLAAIKKRETPEGDIFALQKETEAFLKTGDVKPHKKRWAAIAAAAFIVGWIIALWGPDNAEEFFEHPLLTVVLSPMAAISMFFLMRIVLTALFLITPRFLFSEKKVAAFVSAVNDACDKEKEEQARIQAQIEEERKAMEEELKATEKAARLQRGKELYCEATSGEEINEDLMRKAADLGDPNASLYIGKAMVKDIDGYTSWEIKELYKEAKPYFENADEGALPDGTLLYCSAVMMTESLNPLKAYSLLKKLRSIKNELSKEFEEVYRTSLNTLAEMADDLKHKQEERRKAEAERKPVIKSCYCKFFNAGICNKRSTSYYVSHCDHVSDPGKCSTALLEKGLGFTFE